MIDSSFFISNCCTLPVAFPPIVCGLFGLWLLHRAVLFPATLRRLKHASPAWRMACALMVWQTCIAAVLVAVTVQQRFAPAGLVFIAGAYGAIFYYAWLAFDRAALEVIFITKGALRTTPRIRRVRRAFAVVFCIGGAGILIPTVAAGVYTQTTNSVRFNYAVLALALYGTFGLALVTAAFGTATAALHADIGSMSSEGIARNMLTPWERKLRGQFHGFLAITVVTCVCCTALVASVIIVGGFPLSSIFVFVGIPCIAFAGTWGANHLMQKTSTLVARNTASAITEESPRVVRRT